MMSASWQSGTAVTVLISGSVVPVSFSTAESSVKNSPRVQLPVGVWVMAA